MDGESRCSCGNCGQPIAFPPESNNTWATCPTCSATTLLLAPEPESGETARATTEPKPPPVPKPTSKEEELRQRINRLVEMSDLFVGAAKWCVALAGVAVMIGIIIATQENKVDDFLVSLGIAGGVIGTSIWLYLVGQIIQIRANTER